MEYKINVNGMRCNHCVKSIENEVGNIDGVSSCKVNLDDATVTVVADENVSINTIYTAIDDLGFEVVK